MEESESWKAAAAPWKVPWIVPGMRRSRCASSMARVASPSDPPGFKLKEMVTAGNCPWWATASDVVEGPKWANDDNGTWAPEPGMTYTVCSASGVNWYFGSTSSTTQY